MKEAPVSIGRKESCNVSIKSKLLSRVQCQITYVENNWVLIDGDGTKQSTNGTWVFTEKPFPIRNGMIFKAGLTMFLCILADTP